MVNIKDMFKRIIFLIILISFLISFISIPRSYAILELEGDEFYFAGVTEGEYVTKPSIFGWLLNLIGEVADYLIGIMTMMFRMVFVGWTSLFERLLTDLMEASVGVGIDGDNLTQTDETTGKTVVNHTKISDPSNNITVQAIVFNKVPAFNINFFQNDVDFLYSCTGTGRTLYCMGKDCKVDGYPKTCEECCGKDGNECSCGCGPSSKIRCANCRRYMANVEKMKKAEEDVSGKNRPAILLIRDTIATWYYVLRLLSIAAMLVALITIGIKMAFSTIASDKAVYKRMLVDWIVGMIIVFLIQYVMIFVINLNEILVSQIEETSNKIHSIKMQEQTQNLEGVPEDGVIKKSNADLEINIYELIKTRAYDPKLSVGLTGMIMYMTLVYFAVRYSIVYFKRFFTIAILILIGPPLGVAHALQRTLTGKSSSLKLWFSEFLNNVIIQTVHALIYGIFIATALVLSIQSIAGMLVALMLMNFGLKADKLFRRIFKFGNGGSIADSNAEAGSAERMKSMVNNAVAVGMAAKPAVKMLNNTPYAKMLKGTGKAAAGLTGKAMVDSYNKFNEKFGVEAEASEFSSRFESKVEKMMDKNGNGYEQSSSEGEDNYNQRHRDATEQYLGTKRGLKVAKAMNRYEGLGVQSTSTMTQEMAQAIGAEKLRDDYNKAQIQLALLKKETASSRTEEALIQARQRLVNAEANLNMVEPIKQDNKYIFDEKMKLIGQQIKFKRPKDTKHDIVSITSQDDDHKFRKGAKKAINGIGNVTQYASSIGRTINGTKSNDKYGRGKVSNRDGLMDLTSFRSIMGLTDKNITDLKQQIVQPGLGLISGGAMMIFGTATMAANPTVGMALLAKGTMNTKKSFTPKKGYRPYTGKYTFNKFDTSTLLRAQASAARNATHMADAIVADTIREKHPELVKKIKNGASMSSLNQDPRYLGTENGRTSPHKIHSPKIKFGTAVGIGGAVALAPALSGIVGGAVAGSVLSTRFFTKNSILPNATELARTARKANEDALKMATAEVYKQESAKLETEVRTYEVYNSNRAQKRNEMIVDAVNPDEVAEKVWDKYKEKISQQERASGSGSRDIKPQFDASSIQVKSSQGQIKSVRITPNVARKIEEKITEISQIEMNDSESESVKNGDTVEEKVKELKGFLAKEGIIEGTDEIFENDRLIDPIMTRTINRKRTFEESKVEAAKDIAITRITDATNGIKDESIASKVQQAKSSEEVIEILKASKDDLVEDPGKKSKIDQIDQLVSETGFIADVGHYVSKDTQNGEELRSHYLEGKKKKRKDKLKQIMELDVDAALRSSSNNDAAPKTGVLELPTLDKEFSGTDALLEFIQNHRDENGAVTFKETRTKKKEDEETKIKTTTRTTTSFSLDKNDVNEVVQMLLMRKEMESLNEEASSVVDEKFHSKRKKDNLNDYKKKKLAYLSAEREITAKEESIKFSNENVSTGSNSKKSLYDCIKDKTAIDESKLSKEGKELYEEWKNAINNLVEAREHYKEAEKSLNDAGSVSEYKDTFDSIFDNK